MDSQTAATVLIVDDDTAVRVTLDLILTRAGYRVVHASDGAAALLALAAEPVDAVVLDLVMPGREGLETLVELRQRFPGVSVVAFSGAFDGRFLPMARHLGADAVLPKPLRPRTLRETIAGLLAADKAPAHDVPRAS